METTLRRPVLKACPLCLGDLDFLVTDRGSTYVCRSCTGVEITLSSRRSTDRSQIGAIPPGKEEPPDISGVGLQA